MQALYSRLQIPDLDWLAEGASSLFNEMTTNPKSFSHQTFLKKYLLEMCRGVQALGASVAYQGLVPMEISPGDPQIDQKCFETFTPQ
jgi:hypothetical protein